MAIGIIGKALAGAGAATIPATMEAMKAEIMQERDQRLNQYQTQMQGREFAHQETMQQGEFGHQEEMQGSQEDFQAAEAAKQRQFEQELKQPELALQRTQGALANLSLAQQKLAHSILNEAINSKDPKERANLLTTYNTLVGRESVKVAPAGYDPTTGMPRAIVYNPYDPNSIHSPDGGGGAAPSSGGDKTDYSTLWSGGSSNNQTPPAASSAPTSPKPAPTSAAPSQPTDDSYIRALTGGSGSQAGTLELHNAKNILANMKQSNNFSAPSQWGGTGADKPSIIAELQKALPYAKGQDLTDIQQAIATLSSTK